MDDTERSPDRTPFEEMVDLCIEAGELVERHGTPRLIEMARLLLAELGFELAQRQHQPEKPLH